VNVILVTPTIQLARVRLSSWHDLKLPPAWKIITPTMPDAFEKIRLFARGDAKWSRIENTPISQAALDELAGRYGPPSPLQDLVFEWKKTPWRKR
jgi:hypothetical protein